ncbi:hypothetical protein Cob_v009474 [Colletotrichum orbiculare MAFF 240422]|uniref:N-acetyltransferase domain-containing protein n=1 Tax=Colletotrichum orbiculare (strain 104-T / ATCC 96160 / CBS 514.97 / LARS 414 / MAFF 240422) TaxID=1213857 RepID=A0A484FHG8_COLOR|nr:hypothetical protein Cob_v009474 [Colletotrichum orbiculare MAFF 240422]
MHIRTFTRADIPAVHEVGDSAFYDSELNGWLHPDRRTFPESWRARSILKLQLSLVKPGFHNFVCVTDDEDPSDWPRDQIVGFATWERVGPASDPGTSKWRQNNTGIAQTVERTLLNWQAQYVNFFRLDKSVSRERLAIFEKENAAAGNPVGPVEAFWNVVVLGVHPDWQGRGVGKKLMQWGLDRSDEDKVPIILIATTAGEGLYKRLGFGISNWATTESLAWSKGGAVMIRDIGGQYTRQAEGDETSKSFFGSNKKIDVVFK